MARQHEGASFVGGTEQSMEVGDVIGERMRLLNGVESMPPRSRSMSFPTVVFGRS